MSLNYTPAPIPFHLPCIDSSLWPEVMRWLCGNINERKAYCDGLAIGYASGSDLQYLEIICNWFADFFLQHHDDSHFKKGIVNLKHGQAIVEYYEPSSDQKIAAFDLALCLISHTLNLDGSYKFGFFEKKKSRSQFGYPVIAGSSIYLVNYFELALRFCETVIKGSMLVRNDLRDMVNKQVDLLNGNLPDFKVS